MENLQQLIAFVLALVMSILAALGAGAGTGGGAGAANTPPAKQTSIQQPAAKPAPAPAPKPSANRPVTQQQLLDATNRFRRANGLSTLKAEPALNNLAQDWSKQLAQSGQFYHRPNFANFYPQGWRGASENIVQVGAGATADDMVRAWANSPGHRANMMDPQATHFGVGISVARDGSQIAVQNFARY